jgi:hypothetical protein
MIPHYAAEPWTLILRYAEQVGIKMAKRWIN